MEIWYSAHRAQKTSQRYLAAKNGKQAATVRPEQIAAQRVHPDHREFQVHVEKTVHLEKWEFQGEFGDQPRLEDPQVALNAQQDHRDLQVLMDRQDPLDCLAHQEDKDLAEVREDRQVHRDFLAILDQLVRYLIFGKKFEQMNNL